MQDIQLKEYLHQIWKRRKVVAFFAAAVVVIVTLYTLQQPKVYRATTTVEIGTETPDVAFFQDLTNASSYGWWSAIRYYETQYQIIQSRALLQKVAEKALKEKVLSGGSMESWTSHLQGGLSVEADDNSRLARIMFDDTDAARAKHLSTMIAEVYVDQNLARKLTGIEDAVNWLNERLGEIREEKARKESELQKYKQEYKIVSLTDKGDVSRSNLRALTESLNRLKGRRIEYEAQYRKLSQLVRRSERTEDLLGVLTNDLLTKFKHSLADLRSRRAELTHRYMEKHPEIVRINDEMKELEKLIRQEVGNEVSRLKTKYLLARAEEQSVAKALEAQKLETLRVEEVNRKLTDLQVVANTNQQIFETLQKKIKEADLSALIRSNNIRLVDRALQPGAPIRPKVASNILLALIVGLLGGVGLALFLEYLDDTLKTHEDVERYLKLPLLGVIPHHATEVEGGGEPKQLEFIPLEDSTSTISEFYRTFRTNILFLSRSKEENRLMVVSTGPGEGKTVTALNLAITLGQIGQRTVLVDLDFRRPKLHTCFDSEDRRGITNVLVGERTLDQAIVSSHVPNLDYLLAGSIPPNPAELMSSKELAEVLEELSRRYDRVIIDSSPIAPVTDAVIAAQIVHGVVLVVRAGKTHRKAVLFAHEQLKNINARVLGAVLNDVDISKSTYGSYQYYKYGYSAYTEEKKMEEVGRSPEIPPAPEASAS